MQNPRSPKPAFWSQKSLDFSAGNPSPAPAPRAKERLRPAPYYAIAADHYRETGTVDRRLRREPPLPI